ncbi:MAG: metalloregulator ArsR/SmtB family transcription factor [Chloroflexota bacterium]|nr:metalloregulator ArsR/SmtB family transcription factor [Chloroflexota bacterium]
MMSTHNKQMIKAFQRDQRWLLPYFKALADESRLTLFGLLAERETNVGDLALRMELSEPTVSHHLSKLREVGLVMLRTEGNQRFYRVNPTTLEQFKDAVQGVELLPVSLNAVSDETWIDALPEDFGDEDRALLRDLTQNGQLKQIPSKQVKLLLVLRWLVLKFDVEQLYTEKEVNAIIKTVYPYDHATLRRELVDFGFLRRERGGGKYWVTPESEDTLQQGFAEPGVIDQPVM